MNSRNSIHTSSLALSLLRQSSTPFESFVLSPYSLNSALSIVHDGAAGTTQEELTNFLLSGCSPSEVTDFYSFLALSLPSTANNGVTFKSANRFYVDDKISLKNEYQKHVEDNYQVKVENLDLSRKEESSNEMSKFVEKATDGKITNILQQNDISDGSMALLINATHILAKWKLPFEEEHTVDNTFYAENGERKMAFMSQTDHFHVNQNNEIGTVLIMPYQDEQYSFFYLMPNVSSNLATMRKALTGSSLVNVLKRAKDLYCEIMVPKFKLESKLDGMEILKKLGVTKVFTEDADLSKISDCPIHVTKIQHNVTIETDELGTEGAAVVIVELLAGAAVDLSFPPEINIDRPFLFGIRRDEEILFIGQFTGV